VNVPLHAGESIRVDGGPAWVQVPAGTFITAVAETSLVVYPANEFNVTPIPPTPPAASTPTAGPIKVTPTSPVTVEVVKPA
jgi:hypothetical protein